MKSFKAAAALVLVTLLPIPPLTAGVVTPHPPYPLAAFQGRMTGEITVRATFRKPGTPDKVEVLRKSKFPYLNQFVAEWALANWKADSREKFPSTLTKTHKFFLR